ncbi:siderophore-interacting protein [Qipengyuania sp. 483]
MTSRPEPRTLEVLSTETLSPSMHRLSLGGAGLAGFPEGQAGGYIKLMLPGEGERPIVRTYTIRRQTPEALVVDFALHGGEAAGPATRFALAAKQGDTVRIGGPGPAKPLPAGRDFYLVAGDMTALPAIGVNLEALDRRARGHVAIELQSEEDRQRLDAPSGVTIEWVVNPQPGLAPDLLVDALRAVELPDGNVAAWAACEFSSMRALRDFFRGELRLGGDDLYISSYWKHGLEETKHKVLKREDAEAQAA